MHEEKPHIDTEAVGETKQADVQVDEAEQGKGIAEIEIARVVAEEHDFGKARQLSVYMGVPLHSERIQQAFLNTYRDAEWANFKVDTLDALLAEYGVPFETFVNDEKVQQTLARTIATEIDEDHHNAVRAYELAARYFRPAYCNGDCVAVLREALSVERAYREKGTPENKEQMERLAALFPEHIRTEA